MRHFAFEAVDELRRRGLINTDFFERLVEERPDYSARIKQIRSEWLVDNGRWGEPALGTSFEGFCIGKC
jgi:hypothetical protein